MKISLRRFLFSCFLLGCWSFIISSGLKLALEHETGEILCYLQSLCIREYRTWICHLTIIGAMYGHVSTAASSLGLLVHSVNIRSTCRRVKGCETFVLLVYVIDDADKVSDLGHKCASVIYLVFFSTPFSSVSFYCYCLVLTPLRFRHLVV